MDTSKLTDSQRQIRRNIRAAFLIATVKEMTDALPNYKDAFSRSVIEEMIETCRKHGVDNFGDTPG